MPLTIASQPTSSATKPVSYYARFAPFLRPHLGLMITAGLLVMGVAALNLIMVRFAGVLWDLVTVEKNLQQLTQAIWVFLGVVVAQGILSIGHGYVTTLVSQRVMADFRTHLFAHLQGLSLSFFAKKRTGELLSRLMNDVGVIQSTITETPIDSAKQLVTLIGGVAFLLYMNWRLCLLIVVLLPVLVLVARLFGKRLKGLSTSIQDQTAVLSTLAEEVISGIRVVKSFVQTPRQVGRFKAGIESLMQVNLRRSVILGVFVPTITLLTFAMAAAVLWYGAKQVIEGGMSPGDLIAFVLFAGILIGPFGSAARVFAQIKEAQGAMERVFEILDVKPALHDRPDAIDLPPVRGHVRVHDIQFGYDPSHPVLEDVSFEARPGEVVAFVGPTGAGKTTMVNLLHRFYDPLRGSIEIDGHDVRTVRLESLYRQIGLVPQEIVLFGGTIFENIRYGREDATEDEVVAASRAANAHDFIVELPDGYQTLVGEKGVNLSGGQRQRLAIARAILKQPSLLILDEATSALDARSEMLVQEALDRLMTGKTTFIVAHRFTTVQRADRILVFNKGKVMEEGTHTDLLSQKGLYHHLYTLRLAEDPEARILQ